MRADLIWNPMAGQRDAQQPLREAVEALEEGGWHVRVREAAHPSDCMGLARSAVAEGAGVVIAAGGDGTVNAVANALVGSRAALGVLPLGTGNVWAKQLGLPAWGLPMRHPVREAARGLLEASVRRVDVGRANGRYFLLWTGVGIDAQVAHEVEPLVELRHRLGNVLYAVTGLTVALSFTGTHSTVVLDNRIERRRVVLMIVANIQLYGGGLFQLAPAAYLDDGYLDVFLFRGQGLAATLHHLFSVLTRYHMRDPQMIYYRARTIDIYTDKPMAVQVDGEAAGETPLHVEVVPQALRVLVPPSTPSSLFLQPASVAAGVGGRPCA